MGDRLIKSALVRSGVQFGVERRADESCPVVPHGQQQRFVGRIEYGVKESTETGFDACDMCDLKIVGIHDIGPTFDQLAKNREILGMDGQLGARQDPTCEEFVGSSGILYDSDIGLIDTID